MIHYGGGSVIRSGLMQRVTDKLDAAGIKYVKLGGAVPNPHLSLVYEGIELCRNEKVDFIFNRDTIMNESEVINDCIKLKGILSDDTILAQIPWVKDIEKEKELLRKQQESEYNPFEVDNDRQQILEGQSDTAGKADTSE